MEVEEWIRLNVERNIATNTFSGRARKWRVAILWIFQDEGKQCEDQGLGASKGTVEWFQELSWKEMGKNKILYQPNKGRSVQGVMDEQKGWDFCQL